jgi:hypothetical protein
MKDSCKSFPESGVALAGDVLACLVTATRLHVSRHKGPVYFLARDGWLPWQILQGEVAGSYLSVSRIALRQPLMALNPSQAARWCIDPVSTNTPRSVLAKVDATPEELADSLHRGGFPEAGWDSPLNGKGRRRLALLFPQPAFQTVLDRLRELKAPLVRAYLDQSGLLSCEAASVVDIGWNGSCHQHLQAWRSEAGFAAETLGGIYLGLQSRTAFSVQTPLTAVWEPGRIGSTLFSHPSFYALAEMFLTADHGGVIGYERIGDKIMPVSAPHNSIVYNKWGLDGFQQGMMERARARSGETEGDLKRIAEQTAEAFDRFASRPTRAEAISFGNWPACVDVAHGEAHDLAPEMTFSGMWNFFIHRRPQPVLWREGVAARLNGPHRFAFRAANELDLLSGRFKKFVSELRG